MTLDHARVTLRRTLIACGLLLLFLLSFVLHALGGHAEFNQQQLEHGASTVSLWSFVTSSQFWFQSMQNWQSEFLAVAALTVLGVLAAWMFVRPAPSRPPYQLSIAPPSNGTFLFARNRQGGLAVSPDGTTIAFVAVVDGRIQLWTRRLDSASAQPVPGTDGAYYPFWSPDSRWIAKLLGIPIDEVNVALQRLVRSGALVMGGHQWVLR
jgi:hypothetical protein